MTQYFMSHGASATQANGQAMGYIGHLVQMQATILAYIDVFHVCAIAAAVMIPLVVLLVRRVNLHAPVATAAH